MEKKLTGIYEAKVYPSNIAVTMRYEDEDGDNQYYSFNVNMDYIRNSEWLEDYSSADEANMDIEDNVYLDIKKKIPEELEWDGDIHKLPLSRWTIGEEEIERKEK